MNTLLKYDQSWQEPMTWKYNAANPGEPFTSLLDRIQKDDLFKLNIILSGGWTDDTLIFLPRLIQQARDQKEWNRKYAHIAYEDRHDYYIRRSERFKQTSAPGGAASSSTDAPCLSDYDRRVQAIKGLGKGKGLEAAAAAPTRDRKSVV